MYTSGIQGVGSKKTLSFVVQKNTLKSFYWKSLKNGFLSLEDIINYFFPILFVLIALVISALYPVEINDKQLTSYENNATSTQIKKHCIKDHKEGSLEYKLCVKHYEKKLY